MEKFILKVPRGIRFISEWKEFKLPEESHILDKKIPGCGFTEWVLRNDENVILCSPRLMLINNKADQHKGEVMTVMGSGIDLGIDIDLEAKPKSVDTDKVIQKQLDRGKVSNEAIANIQDGLYSYIAMRGLKSLKIITTYDSFPILKDILEFNKILDKFKIYIDEFQSIFTDSRFKVDTETRFVDSLKGLNPCYVSATPMMEDYLKLIPEFKDLPYYELDWTSEDPVRTVSPELKPRTCKSIITKANEIIQTYLSGNFERVIVGNKVVESKEATMFVNSVANIISIIKKAKLEPDQVNILCAKTDENENKIKKKLGKEFTIGSVPLKDELRKMFTFCTRTVYLGADFYSDNSRTFIFSDANIETLSVDISLDLPQIMGRQRLNSNPWKNTAEFYYKTLFRDGDNRNNITQALIDKKIESTYSAIGLIKDATNENYRKEAIRLLKYNIVNEKYKSSYASLSYKNGKEEFVLNNLVFISEQRAFDIQNIDYANRFVMFNTIDSVLGSNTSLTNKKVSEFWAKYKTLTRMEDKLRMICESDLSNEEYAQIEVMVELSVRNYLSLGKEKLKACGYQHLKKFITTKTNELSIDLDSIIYSEFKEGDKLSKKDLKLKLANIFSSNKINKTAKASDIEKWFEVKRCRITINKKQSEGLELVKKKK